MYNLHLYQLQQKQHTHHLKQIHSDHIIKLKHKQINQELSQNYNKKILKFINYATTNPVIYNNNHTHPDNLIPRILQNDKILQNRQFYITGHKTQANRINYTIKLNQRLDYSPIKSFSSHQFRIREKSKQIQSEMKYKPRTSIQRIQNYIENTISTQLFDNFTNKKLSKNLFQNANKIKNGLGKISYLSHEASKNLLPTLHNKTHFKGLQQLSLKIPFLKSSNSKKNSIRQKVDEKDNKNQNPQFNQTKNTLVDSNLKKNTKRMDLRESSKKILQDCQVINKRSQSVKILHRGQGRMFFQH